MSPQADPRQHLRMLAKLAGRTLSETDLTGSGLVVLVRRDTRVVDAGPRTRIRRGDRLTLLGKPDVIDRLRARFGAT